MINLLAAIQFDPHIRGILVVLVGVGVLIGSVYLLLATNTGIRNGFLIAMAGLFSFLLAYNDFAVTAMLLSQDNQTMIPKISSFLGTIQAENNVMFAVAAVVSATVPLFILVLFFQRQIVSGLTAGAVKG